MANLTVKQLATTHGDGEKTPQDNDALLLEQQDTTPAWCAVGALPFVRGAIRLEVVSELPGSPDANTLYIVTGAGSP